MGAPVYLVHWVTLTVAPGDLRVSCPVGVRARLCMCTSAETRITQKQVSTPLKAYHPKRPTITLVWSFEHPLGIFKRVCGQPIREASR